MNRLKLGIALAMLSLLLWQCVEEKYPGYAVTESDIYYNLLATDGDERLPVAGDYLTLLVTYSTLTDSIIYNSDVDSRDGYMTVVLPDSIEPGSYYESLAMMHQGDSAAMLLNAETFFSSYLKQDVPAFLRADNRVKVNIRMQKIRNAEEVKAHDLAYQDELLRREMQEQADLQGYLNANNIDSTHYYRGLYIVMLDSGQGSLPQMGDLVSIHFTGTTLDGKAFDSTYDRDQPIDFSIGSPGIVIKGLEAGVKRMREGAKAKFIIPSQLAFGERGVRGIVEPYSTLIYEVELIKLN